MCVGTRANIHKHEEMSWFFPLQNGEVQLKIGNQLLPFCTILQRMFQSQFLRTGVGDISQMIHMCPHVYTCEAPAGSCNKLMIAASKI